MILRAISTVAASEPARLPPSTRIGIGHASTTALMLSGSPQYSVLITSAPSSAAMRVCSSQPLSIPCILNSCATSDRFNDQGQAEMLTLARDPRNALDFASFKFRITAADNHKRDDRVRACPEGVFRLCNEATAKGVRRKLAGCAHCGSPVKPGDEAWQILLCRHLRKLSNHSQ